MKHKFIVVTLQFCKGTAN